MNRKGTVENLDPVKTKEEARRRGHNGGVKSGEARRKKKQIKDTIEVILDGKIKDPEMKETLKNLGVKGTPTYRDYLTMMIVTRTAEKGTMTDLYKLAELLGETEESADAEVLAEAKMILDAVPSCIDNE